MQEKTIKQRIIIVNDDKEGILRKVAEPLTKEDDLQVTLLEMYDYVKKTRFAVGLALPQVGISKRAFVMSWKDRTGKNFGQIVINPEIIEQSEAQGILKEGCLSEPRVQKEVKRPMRIRVKYQTIDFDEKTRTFTGYQARVFMHEYDHLEGILLTDK